MWGLVSLYRIFLVFTSISFLSPDVRVARQAEFVEAVKDMSQIIQEKAVELGVSKFDDILYPNYALIDTPLELLYGENVPRLKEIAAKFDPEKVMSLSGGFRFQT